MIRKQNERYSVRRPCVKHLRTMIFLNQLKRYYRLDWQCSPDHGKVTLPAAAAMKLDGYEKGVFDMTIVAANKDLVKVWFIEFKYGNGSYTYEQEAKMQAFKDTPVQFVTIYSLNEFKDFIDKELK